MRHRIFTIFLRMALAIRGGSDHYRSTEFRTPGANGDDGPVPSGSSAWRRLDLLSALILSALLVPAQSVAAQSAAVSSPSTPRYIIVLPGDDVIPHVVNGDGWSTQVILTNLSSTAEGFTLLFFSEKGDAWRVPIAGREGTTSRISTMLAPAQTMVFDTTGAGPLQQGWVGVLPDHVDTVRIGGMAVFRYRTSANTLEAVVPISSLFNTQMVMVYDNADGFATGIALVNPDPESTASVSASIRDLSGDVIATDSLSLPPLAHTAFVVADRFPATGGKRGSILFSTSAKALSGLGIRANPQGAFTSFNPLNTVDMLLRSGAPSSAVLPRE